MRAGSWVSSLGVVGWSLACGAQDATFHEVAERAEAGGAPEAAIPQITHAEGAQATLPPDFPFVLPTGATLRTVQTVTLPDGSLTTVVFERGAADGAEVLRDAATALAAMGMAVTQGPESVGGKLGKRTCFVQLAGSDVVFMY